MNITTTTKPSHADAQRISQGIIDFNRNHVPNLERIKQEVKFFTFARDVNEKVVGGIRATCFWNTLHIELLWLAEDYRGKGMGRQLMEAAEQFAQANNCEKAFVETTSWQARPFYEKLGYEHLATLNDRPKGHATHYLSKDLG